MGNRDFRFTDGFKGLCALLNKSFRLNITEDELSFVNDVGELHSMIAARYSQKYREGCLTAPVFYSLRRGLMACGIRRDFIKRRSSLVALLPNGNVKENWAKLEENVGLSLEPLRVYSPVQFGIAASLLVGYGLVFFGVTHFTLVELARATFGTGIGMIALSFGLGQLKIQDPNTVFAYPTYRGTVGQAAKELLSQNYDEFARRSSMWSGKDLMMSLQSLISYVSDLASSEITSETKFEDIDFDEAPGFPA